MLGTMKHTLQNDYLNLGSPHYLAHCAIAPLGKSINDAMRSEMRHFCTHASGIIVESQLNVQRLVILQDLRRYRSNYAFVPNTSFGINQIAHAIQWHHGDQIISKMNFQRTLGSAD